VVVSEADESREHTRVITPREVSVSIVGFEDNVSQKTRNLVPAVRGCIGHREWAIGDETRTCLLDRPKVTESTLHCQL